ncbi:MAG: MATE family efflux transporter [Rhodobacteraceae bacterium]|nr:MATE family efflux transporter [Paracoccaceae bacterium]
MDDLTHKRVAKIAIPIVLANASVPILGAVDTGVVGQMGSAVPIGAVGLGAITLTAIYWIFGFLRMGTVGLTSQAIGAGDKAETVALLSRAIVIGLGAGLCIIALQGLLFRGAFYLSPGSDEVEALAREYMRIRVMSAPAAIALYGVTGWLLARERTVAVLALQLGMNGLNVVLDFYLVMQLEWGVAGVAWATFAAEWSALFLGLYLCRDVFKNPAWHDAARVFDRVILKRMAMVNFDILIRSALLQAIFVSFLFLGAGFDDVTLAANQILLQFLFVTSYAMDGSTSAVETLVGQAMGARNRPALRRAVVLTSQWAAGIVVLLALGFAVFGGWIGDVMTNATDVRAALRVYLPYMVLAPLVGAAAWLFDGIFIGATRTKDMRNMMIISAVVYLVAILTLVPVFGNHGLWAALLISFIMRGVTLGLRYPALERSAS